jgi:RNA polymerase sigma-70 factor (ECF subfamily)
MANDVEENIIRRAINGDIEAFETIVYQYEKKVYNIAYQMFGNEHDAKDISQDVFMKVYKNIGKFAFNASFSTWIHRIAVNTSIDAYRKKKKANSTIVSFDRNIESEDNSIIREIKDNSLSVEDCLIQKETTQEIRDKIHLLKEEHKTVIILRDINGFSYEEISEILDCQVGTVKSRISRARHALKKLFE